MHMHDREIVVLTCPGLRKHDYGRVVTCGLFIHLVHQPSSKGAMKLCPKACQLEGS